MRKIHLDDTHELRIVKGIAIVVDYSAGQTIISLFFNLWRSYEKA